MKTLINKEIMSLIKTKKFIILFFVALFIGIASPLFAYYMPEIIDSLGGFDIDFGEITIAFAYEQLIKNNSQMFLFVVIFMSVGIFVNEKTKNTIILLLAKSIKREDIIISKLIVSVVYIFLSLLISTSFFLFYSYILFDTVHVVRIILYTITFFGYTIFIVLIGLYFSIVGKNFISAVSYTFIAYFGLGIIDILDNKILDFIPTSLNNYSSEFLINGDSTVNLMYAFIGFVIFSIVLIYLSIKKFENQEF